VTLAPASRVGPGRPDGRPRIPLHSSGEAFRPDRVARPPPAV